MIGARGGAANFFWQGGSMDVDTAYNIVYSVYILLGPMSIRRRQTAASDRWTNMEVRSCEL
jgi:hypothetical protein